MTSFKEYRSITGETLLAQRRKIGDCCGWLCGSVPKAGIGISASQDPSACPHAGPCQEAVPRTTPALSPGPAWEQCLFFPFLTSPSRSSNFGLRICYWEQREGSQELVPRLIPATPTPTPISLAGCLPASWCSAQFWPQRGLMIVLNLIPK